MYYIKTLIFQQIARSKFLTIILHKLWIFYQYTRSSFLKFLFFKLRMNVKSLSDRGQDKWIIDIFELNRRKYKGFFLEIGGGDGFSNSNTFVLENNYKWRGIVVEPDPDQFKKLKINRPKTKVSNKLIYSNNKFVNFIINGELSRITKNNKSSKNKTIKLKTITLNKLLKNKKAPKNIDFFSLDVEGSEDKVLTKEALDKFTFMALTIERPSIKLHNLLIKRNYVFIKSKIYDYFYINKKHEFYKNIIKKKKNISFFYKKK